jgi:hypothetical protein
MHTKKDIKSLGVKIFNNVPQDTNLENYTDIQMGTKMSYYERAIYRWMFQQTILREYQQRELKIKKGKIHQIKVSHLLSINNPQ